ncbi:hypothetical protein BH23ACT10_BH23ACT10_09190 [soil metagenome]
MTSDAPTPPGGIHQLAFVRAPIGTAIVDAHDRFVIVNPAFERLVGRSADDLVGTGLGRVISDDDLTAIHARLDSDDESAVVSGDVRYRHASRPESWALASVRRIPEAASHRRTVWQLQDINARKQAERRVAEQVAFRSALLDLSNRSHGRVTGGDFFQVLIDRAVEVVPGAHAGSVLLREEGSDRYRFAATVGFDHERLSRTYLRSHELFRGTSEPRALILHEIDNSALPEDRRRIIDDAGRVSEIVVSIAVPVNVDGQPIALVILNNFADPDAFDEIGVEMATLLAQQIVDLQRRQRLEQDLHDQKEAYRHLALHDGLTGLPNRALFEERLERALVATRRTGATVGVVFCDVDDFKHVNDSAGHHVGDELLKETGRRLQAAVRAEDTVARWGGDEFVVLLVAMDADADVNRLVERLVEPFVAQIVVAERVIRWRLSVGAVVVGAGWSVERVMQEADRAQYEAKRAGDDTAVVRVLRRPAPGA